MPITEPALNEFQRALLRPATIALLPLPSYVFKPVPEYNQTSLVEWAVCKRYDEKYSPIIQKSGDGLATYWSEALPLDHGWLGSGQTDWVCCPQCGRAFPKEARYWWVRNKAKGYYWMDACRDCKCATGRRVRDSKRFARLTVQRNN